VVVSIGVVATVAEVDPLSEVVSIGVVATIAEVDPLSVVVSIGVVATVAEVDPLSEVVSIGVVATVAEVDPSAVPVSRPGKYTQEASARAIRSTMAVILDILFVTLTVTAVSAPPFKE